MNSYPSHVLVSLFALSGACLIGCGGSSSESPDAASNQDAVSPSKDAASHDASHADTRSEETGPGDTGTGDTSTGDAGLGDSGHTDAVSPTDASDAQADVQPDAPPDAETDAQPDCGSVAPAGQQIVASKSQLVLLGGGLTSDGYAVYEDVNTEKLYAVPATGGTPTSLGVSTAQGDTLRLNGGKAVLFLAAATSPSTENAPLWAWTPGTGPKLIDATAFSFDAYSYAYDASLDGSYVGYYAGNGSAAVALTVASIDGTGSQTLVTGVDITNQSCYPMVQWVGDTMIAYYCPASGAYAGAQIVTAFSAPSFTPVQIANLGSTNTFTSPGAPSPDGTQLLLSLPSGGLYVYPIAGGNPTTIDATGVNGGWMASGDIIWATAAGGVNEISLAAAEGASDAGAADSGAADSGAADSGAADSGAADSGAADSGAADSGAADSGAADSGAADSGAADSGAADSGAADAGGLKTIASSGVEFLLTISGDGNYFQGGTNFNSSSGLTNVVLLSAATGKVSSQWSQATAEAIGFTADSKYDLFLTNFPTVFGLETFDVYAAPVATGPATKILTGAMQLAFGAGSKLIVGVNPTKATGLTDLQLLDLASPSTPTTIVTQADPTIIYVPGTNKLLYSWYCQPGTPSGLWSTVVP